jgi:circadian clock protein KaiC
MTDPAATPPSLQRIRTHVPGLDEITGGGFLQSGVYILQGAPGAGKTILANQIVHRHAAAGGQVVYVTLLAESHARLLQHMEAFAFFDASAVPGKIYYVSAFNALRSDGLNGVVELLRSEMRSHRAGILVLDGLVMAEGAAGSEDELKIFVSEIQAHSTLTGCTTLLLTSEHADRPVSAEQTMVDGILLLRERAWGPRRERNLEVVKFRGSSTLRGNHAFQIGDKGITIFPRLEAARREPLGDAVLQEGVGTGVAALDAMVDVGGYPKGGVTILSGPSGSGKTTLGLHYIAQATRDEPGVYFGFYEAPALLRRMVDVLGIVPRAPLDAGQLHFLWQPFGENGLDALAARVLAEVQRTGAKRVVLDGIGGFMAATGFAERGGSFIASLLNELRRLGATTLATVEENDINRGRAIDTPTMSATCDMLLELSVRMEGRVRRYLAIRKSRVSRCDLHVREMVLTPAGVDLAEPEDILAG